MTFLLDIWDYLLVFLLAAVPWFEIGLIIPVSILAGMNAFWVAILAFFGNLLTVYLLIVFFDRLKGWFFRKKKKEQSDQEEDSGRYARANRMWDKYGVSGLLLAGPFLTGSHIAAGAAIVFGATKTKTLYWSTISLGLWTLVFTIGSIYGLGWLTDVNLSF
ncbi:small multi-drug export protein [Allobacillus halotolerans]|uniref:small multi-drug export protein n=1 Tax=Allobacillus halotolerans TaxID=570278 RepID=UPI001FEBF0D3|nr:small multi-drug export protein [Allobacillus halotolerans]